LRKKTEERKSAEETLRKAHDELETLVQERTRELQRANESVNAERQRFYYVLEMLPAYVVLLTPDYHVPFANRFFRERFGESGGKRCYEYLFGRMEPCEICETYTVMKTNAPHHWEWTGPDGCNYDIYDFPFTDADGSQLIMEVGIDITKGKQAEKTLREINETLEQRVAERTAELRESEERVRRKLDIILSPEGHMDDLDLSDIFDASAIQSLMEDFYKLAHIPMAIIDLKGKVLIGVGWQEICLKFHRVHTETCGHCIDSDTQLSAAVPPGEFKLYKCKNNMWDAVTPIIVGGQHVGNLFTGQFFFEDEPIDYEFFRSQARQYGFDEDKYMAALESVPRLSREKLDTSMAFFLKFADILSKLSYSNFKLARSLAERDTLMGSLRESEERFRSLTENSPDCIALHDPELRHIYVNPAISELVGLPLEAFVGKTVFEMGMPSETASQLDSLLRLALETGQKYSGELDFPTPGGTRFFNWRSVPIFSSDGTISAILAIAGDITVLKQAETGLQHSLQRFQLLARTAGELLQSSDLQKTLESLFRKVMERLGCQTFFNFLVDEEAGKLRLNTYAGIPEDEAKKIEWLDYGAAVCGCAARGAERIVAEHIQTTPDERAELVKSYGIKAYACHPLLGPGGKVIGTLSFGTKTRETFSEDDLSLMKAVTDQVAIAMDRMRSEQAMIESAEDLVVQNVKLGDVNRELEAFIYSVSHDLRAPLRTISGFAKILADDHAGQLDEQGRDYLARISRGSAKMSRLIEDLLDLSKISKQELRGMEIDLSKLASNIVSGLREANPERKVDIVIEEGLKAYVDKPLMEIVLSNFLGNAWKFTSKTDNARIEFGSLEQGGKTVYFVRDNGAGFDPTYKDKMFGPFQRLHSEKEFPGTGIGLTIVERIISRHGGKVWAEGDVGKGAVIYFTLG